jgi:hypothetical protein
MTGTGRRRILMMGHIDTVYQAGILNTQPFKREGNKLYGPGIADDKGGIAVILHALKILADAGWKDFDQITVLFNPDKEVGSVGSGELIAGLADQQEISVREVRSAAGAEFVVMVCGNIMTMPGLPKSPSAGNIDYVDGKVVGLF